MKKTKSFLAGATALTAGLALFGATANANTITPSHIAPPGGGAGIWLYGADHTSGELHAGDAFTIFDFGGYVAGSVAAPPLWTASAVLLGSLPGGGSLGPDDPGQWNLQFVYTGPTLQNTGAFPLGFFTAVTTSTTIVVDDWISQDHLLGTLGVTGDGALGTLHRDSIVVPGPVPEGGATVALLGFACLGLAAWRKKLAAS